MTRESEVLAFLEAAGWQDATRSIVPGDASTRRYERLTLDSRKAVLMDAPKGAETPSEPEGATPEQRRALGYNATARLAGPNIEAFICIAEALTQRGFSAPQIISADITAGFVLLEDLGDDLYARVMTRDAAQERPLYDAAIDTLAAIYRSSFAQTLSYQNTTWRVRDYDSTALLAEIDLCLDWYAKDLGPVISGDAREEFYGLWRDVFRTLDAHAPGLALRDFHAENLFWLPDRATTSRVGLIDFQDGLFVHPAYDLMSLLEDARRDVPRDLAEILIRRFCDKAGIADDASFRAAYAVLGAQRNTKLLGFPVRADIAFGKPQYRALLPRIKGHLNHDLAHPALDGIKAWFAHHIPEILS